MSELKAALFWEQLPDNAVRCRLCPWDCRIKPGRIGFCGVRQNQEGKLYSLIYGRVSSVAVDPIEKKPLYHFHPNSKVFSLGTFGCNLRCGHCQNWQIAHVTTIPEAEYLSPERAIEMAIESGSAGIAWTYNEPTIWFEYTLDCAKLAKAAGLYTVYVTNGYINPEPLEMILPYLDAYRLDLKGFNKEFYFKLAKIRDFSPVLAAGILAKKKWGKHVEIITLVIPTMNDDEKQLNDLAAWIAANLGPETPWHVNRFSPYLEFSHLPATPLETLERARAIGQKAGLKYVYIGNVPGHPAGVGSRPLFSGGDL